MLFLRRIQAHKQHKNTPSARITNIATLAVAIGIAAILIGMSTSKGLQKEIQKKTSVFNGHILVTFFENNEFGPHSSLKIAIMTLKIDCLFSKQSFFTFLQ